MARTVDPEIIPPGETIDDPDDEALLEHVAMLARLLDTRYSIAGIRFGWDSILGLVPVVGDTLTTALGAWIIVQAHRAGAPGHLKARMIANAGIDYLVGLVPLIGDLGDLAFKANMRNARLLRDHLEERKARRPPPGPST